MGIKYKTIEILLNPRNIKHYRKLNYVDRDGGWNPKDFGPINKKILVNIIDLPKGSEINIIFICDKCGIEFEISWKLYNRRIEKTDGKCFCESCFDYKIISYLQKDVSKYLISLGFNDIRHEYDCKIKCINPKTNHLLPYDNEIFINKKGLVIEVHGPQHYKAVNWFGNTDDNKYNFKYLVWKDNYKEDFALNNGYYYLVIPYWTEKDHSWQTLIDDMIDTIKSEENE